MPRVTEHGSFDNLERWLKQTVKSGSKANVEAFAKTILDALKSGTPVDTSKTANSWFYKISKTGAGWEIEFMNSNINKGVSIAKILHYGHGTGTGGWVPGTHYITSSIDKVYGGAIDKVLSDIIK